MRITKRELQSLIQEAVERQLYEESYSDYILIKGEESDVYDYLISDYYGVDDETAELWLDDYNKKNKTLKLDFTYEGPWEEGLKKYDLFWQTK